MGFQSLNQNFGVFLIRRFALALVSVFIIASMTFLLLHQMPGGPFDKERALFPSVRANMEKRYGLHLSLGQQYWNYMRGLLQGDLGLSYEHEGREVIGILRESFPVSFQLGFYALVLSLLIGIPWGVLSGAKGGRPWNSMAMGLASAALVLPSFLVAPVLITLFSFGWPLDRLSPPFHEWLMEYDLLLPSALWSSPRHFILPVITLTIRPAALIARLTRASVLDVLGSDFVRTARAKGLRDSWILYGHVLANAFLPLITSMGPLVAGLLSGSFVVEIIFGIPGMAKFFVQGVFNRDYPLVMALTLLFSLLLILTNLLVDCLHKWLDPRIEVL